MPKKISKKKKTGSKKKKTVKRPIKRKKPASKKIKKTTGKKKEAPKPSLQLPSEPIGRVTHYFPKVKATAVMIERDGIKLGDMLYFKGHTTRFKQRVDSMQLEHQKITEAFPGQEVGIRTKSRTRERDLVFKL